MLRIWALADTHLSFAHPKPMDIFGDHWRDHPRRIEQACRAVIEPNDLLLIPGDISWALKREAAEPDLDFLAALPGIKVLCKGNHDFWWSSDKPLRHPQLNDTPFISACGRVGVAGTRGWYTATSAMPEEERVQCRKIISRECVRLAKRLDKIATCPVRIAMVHYPPILEFLPILQAASVPLLLYGHVHLGGSEHPLPEAWHGLRALCVAADRLNFAPRLVQTLDEI